jgi:hypothetical protein
VILVQLPAQVDLDRMLAESTVKDAAARVKRKIRICGNQPAVFAQMTGATGGTVNLGIGSAPGSKEARSDVHFLGTNVGGKTYLAMYVRPIGAAVDPAAESAIRDVAQNNCIPPVTYRFRW